VSQDATGDALRYCERMRDLILLHGGGWPDAEALSAFRLFSGAAARAADDADCAKLLQSAEDYAAELFSESAHYRWARGSTSGADILRLCILGKLHALRERLTALEAERQWPLDSRWEQSSRGRS
jgi:hypothetical protein